MPVVVVALVLGSAVAHAAWNALLKRHRDPEVAVVGVLAVAALGAVALAGVRGVPLPSRASMGWCLVSGALEVGYFATLARALSRAPLGMVYTVVRGGALLVLWPISVGFLGEKPTAKAIVATLLVASGLAASGMASRGSAGRGAVARGVGWAFVCAVFVGGYHAAYKLALGAGGAPEFVTALSLGSASMANVALLGRAKRARAWAAVSNEPLPIVGAGLLATVGFVVFLAAMARSGAGAVTTLRNTSILFAQVFGVALGERPRRLGIAGSVIVTAGAVLLAWP